MSAENRTSEHGPPDATVAERQLQAWRMHTRAPDCMIMFFHLYFAFPQVNDFLAGKSPLTLAMRLGDHMMFVQLQLSTSQSNSKRTTNSRHRSVRQHHHHAGSSRHSHYHHLRQAETVSSPLATHQTPASQGGVSSSSSHSLMGSSTNKVVTPVPVHAQQEASTSTRVTSAASRSGLSFTAPAPGDAGLTPSRPPPQLAAPASGLAPKRPELNGLPVLDSTALAEASRNLSQKLKELSAASSSHIDKNSVDVKQSKVQFRLAHPLGDS